MARGFTDIAIRNLKKGDKRKELPDPAARGLYVIVEPSGFKSFAVRFRFDGKPKKLSLGNISLSAARKAAAHALHEVEEGRDPTIAKKEARAKRRAIEADTFAAIVERYFQIECGLKRDGDKLTFNDKDRTAARRLADLERLVLPTLGKRPVSEVRRSEVVAVLDNIQLENGPVMADRTLGYVRKIFNWHATRADDFKTPIVRGMARTKSSERARKRILTDDEIRKVWVNTEGPFFALIKFLLLSGARRDEAARMTWDEVKDGIWELPAERNKTKLPLLRPLSTAALAVIESQRRDDGGRYVFTNDGKTPFQNFARSKKEFDAITGTSGWVVHDLRRTARSLLSKVQVPERHSEECLGHVIGGIKGRYDQHSYFDEKRDAYDKLAALLTRIITPPPDNVTALHKNKRA
jgi:integrase